MGVVSYFANGVGVVFMAEYNHISVRCLCLVGVGLSTMGLGNIGSFSMVAVRCLMCIWVGLSPL